MKTLVFTFIDASPLGPFQNIYRAEWKERNSVKKITLSDRREFGIFRSVMKAVGSHRPRSRFESFFYDTKFSSVLYGTLVLCVSLFSGVKRERAVYKVSYQNKKIDLSNNNTTTEKDRSVRDIARRAVPQRSKEKVRNADVPPPQRWSKGPR